jgi:hypothetical protein
MRAENMSSTESPLGRKPSDQKLALAQFDQRSRLVKMQSIPDSRSSEAGTGDHDLGTNSHLS